MATENTFKYNCENCDYHTSKTNDWNRHLSSTKHKMNRRTEAPVHICSICNKSYYDRTGLWKHKKKCVPNKPAPSNTIHNNTNDIKMNMIMEYIKQSESIQETHNMVIKNILRLVGELRNN